MKKYSVLIGLSLASSVMLFAAEKEEIPAVLYGSKVPTIQGRLSLYESHTYNHLLGSKLSPKLKPNIYDLEGKAIAVDNVPLIRVHIDFQQALPEEAKECGYMSWASRHPDVEEKLPKYLPLSLLKNTKNGQHVEFMYKKMTVQQKKFVHLRLMAHGSYFPSNKDFKSLITAHKEDITQERTHQRKELRHYQRQRKVSVTGMLRIEHPNSSPHYYNSDLRNKLQNTIYDLKGQNIPIDGVPLLPVWATLDSRIGECLPDYFPISLLENTGNDEPIEFLYETKVGPKRFHLRLTATDPHESPGVTFASAIAAHKARIEKERQQQVTS